MEPRRRYVSDSYSDGSVQISTHSQPDDADPAGKQKTDAELARAAQTSAASARRHTSGGSIEQPSQFWQAATGNAPSVAQRATHALRAKLLPRLASGWRALVRSRAAEAGADSMQATLGLGSYTPAARRAARQRSLVLFIALVLAGAFIMWYVLGDARVALDDEFTMRARDGLILLSPSRARLRILRADTPVPDVVTTPCRRLSITEAAKDAFPGSASGTYWYKISNLVDAMAAAGRAAAVSSPPPIAPKLLDIESVDAEAAGDPPNVCMLAYDGLLMLNPTITEQGALSASAFIEDDMLPDDPRARVEVPARISVHYRDWPGRQTQLLKLRGREAAAAWLAVRMLNDGVVPQLAARPAAAGRAPAEDNVPTGTLPV